MIKINALKYKAFGSYNGALSGLTGKFQHTGHLASLDLVQLQHHCVQFRTFTYQ